MSWFDEKAHFIENKTGSLKFAHSLESSANSASNATFRNTLASSGEKREPYEANAFIMGDYHIHADSQHAIPSNFKHGIHPNFFIHISKLMFVMYKNTFI